MFLIKMVLSELSDLYKKLSNVMETKDIEKAAGDYSGSVLGFKDNNSVMDKHKAFVDGAKWRINSIWHSANEKPIKHVCLLLIEDNNGEFDLGYTFEPSKTKRWAYVKDLTPNM